MPPTHIARERGWFYELIGVWFIAWSINRRSSVSLQTDVCNSLISRHGLTESALKKFSSKLRPSPGVGGDVLWCRGTLMGFLSKQGRGDRYGSQCIWRLFSNGIKNKTLRAHYQPDICTKCCRCNQDESRDGVPYWLGANQNPCIAVKAFFSRKGISFYNSVSSLIKFSECECAGVCGCIKSAQPTCFLNFF